MMRSPAEFHAEIAKWKRFAIEQRPAVDHRRRKDATPREFSFQFLTGEKENGCVQSGFPC
jgi:hypothetical protein